MNDEFSLKFSKTYFSFFSRIFPFLYAFIIYYKILQFDLEQLNNLGIADDVCHFTFEK